MFALVNKLNLLTYSPHLIQSCSLIFIFIADCKTKTSALLDPGKKKGNNRFVKIRGEGKTYRNRGKI